MGCKKHHGHPSVVAGPATLAVHSVLPHHRQPKALSACDKSRYRRRNAPFSRKVPVFHRRQLGLLGANATAAIEVQSPAVEAAAAAVAAAAAAAPGGANAAPRGAAEAAAAGPRRLRRRAPRSAAIPRRPNSAPPSAAAAAAAPRRRRRPPRPGPPRPRRGLARARAGARAPARARGRTGSRTASRSDDGGTGLVLSSRWARRTARPQCRQGILGSTAASSAGRQTISRRTAPTNRQAARSRKPGRGGPTGPRCRND